MGVHENIWRDGQDKTPRHSPGETDRIDEKKPMWEWPVKRDPEELQPRISLRLRASGWRVTGNAASNRKGGLYGGRPGHSQPQFFIFPTNYR